MNKQDDDVTILNDMLETVMDIGDDEDETIFMKEEEEDDDDNDATEFMEDKFFEEDDDPTEFDGINKEYLETQIDLNTLSDVDNVPQEKASVRKAKDDALPIDYLFIDKYRIEKVLGQGGFGITYLAEEERTYKKVVIKEYFAKAYVIRNEDNSVVIKKGLSQKAKVGYKISLAIFVEEAQSLVKITSKSKHNNVVNYVAFEENVNNTKYFLMDYEDGTDFDIFLKENGKLTQKEIIHYSVSILKGLTHIHNAEVYHKDIKPANIYLKENNEPMLIDFGASVISADLSTPSYAPIEQIKKHRDEYGPYTDLYAFGVMLYEIVKGKKPPKVTEREKALSLGKRDPYIPLFNDNTLKKEKYSKYFLKAIDWSLKFSYEDRPQTAIELSDMISGTKEHRQRRIIFASIMFLIVTTIATFFYMQGEEGFIGLDIKDRKAQLRIDGNPVKRTVDDLYLVDVGKHTIEVSSEGFVPYTQDLKVETDKTVSRGVNLIPKMTKLFIETAKLDAEVFINDEYVGRSPVTINVNYNKDKIFKIKAKKKGYDLASVVKTYNQLLLNSKINLTLRKKEGKITFRSDPEGAIVYIDGDKVVQKTINGTEISLKTPFSIIKPIGIYSIVMHKPGYKIKKIKDYKVKDKDKKIINYVLESNKVIKKVKKKPKKKKKPISNKYIVPTMKHIQKNFYIAEYEVTNEEITRFLNSTKLPYDKIYKYFQIRSKIISRFIKIDDEGYYVFNENFKNYPITNISWYGAKAYTQWLSKVTGRKFRLPTGREWAYIAKRAGSNLESINHISLNSVKSKKADKLGLYDLYGNVFEWCENKLGRYSREIRGGSFKTKSSLYKYDYSNMVNENSVSNADLGFRIIEIK